MSENIRVIEGAGAIALAIFGDRKKRKRVFDLQDVLPLFRLSQALCARPATLERFFDLLEAQTPAGRVLRAAVVTEDDDVGLLIAESRDASRSNERPAEIVEIETTVA
jgi:hypothetical protein